MRAKLLRYVKKRKVLMALHKKLVVILVAVFMLSACGTSAGADLDAEGTGYTEDYYEMDREQVRSDFADNSLSPALQLVVGTLLMEDSDLAVDSELAATLIPYWKLFITLTESDTTAHEELDALVEEIQLLMTSDQVNHIISLALTQEDMMALIDELGIFDNLRPEGFGDNDGDGSSLPEGRIPGDGGGPGGGQGRPGTEDLDPELIATMQARRGEDGGGFGANRMTIPLIEQLINLFEQKSAN